MRRAKEEYREEKKNRKGLDGRWKKRRRLEKEEENEYGEKRR